MSADLPEYSPCSGTAACLSVARQEGFPAHVLTPSVHVADHGQDYLYPHVGHSNVGVVLSYQEVGSDRAFVEVISTPLNLLDPQPCLAHPPLMQPARTLRGRTVCLVDGVVDASGIGVRFYSSGMMYQLAPTAGVPQSTREAFLLTLVDKLR